MKTHYSCAELAAMKLPKLPGSEAGWLKFVKREAWPFNEVSCAGGKSGIKREFAPPAHIAKLIEAHQVGANVTTRVGDGKQYVITLDMTVGEAAAMLIWLEKRRARRG